MTKALDAANGRAISHAFDSRQLATMGREIKRHLSQWFTLAEMQGICGHATSGEALPNAYKYPRVINKICWDVGASGNVFVTGITTEQAWNKAGEISAYLSTGSKEIVAKKAIRDAMNF